LSAVNPYGEFDAVAFWNLKAKFLFRGGQNWDDLFSSELVGTHQDYPVLVPSIVARAWNWLGVDSEAAPRTLAFCFAALTLLTLGRAVGALCTPGLGWLAAGLLMTLNAFVTIAVGEGADVPLCFFILAATLCAFWPDDEGDSENQVAGGAAGRPSPSSRFALAGLFAGLAAFSKNEGVLFLLVFLGVAVLFAVVRQFRFPPRSHRRGIASVTGFVLGIAAPLVVWAWFKHRAPSKVDLLDQSSLVIRAKMLQLSRYRATIAALPRALLSTGPTLLAMAGYAVLAGGAARGSAGRTHQDNGAAAGAFLIALGMLGADFFAYIITPNDIRWHVTASALRLFLQTFPLLIFAWALRVRSPETLVT
jgi:hypothetical protein